MRLSLSFVRGLGWAMFVVLSVIAAIHVYWGLGGLWPADSTRELIDTVVGDTRMTRMPPAWLTLTVAALIFAAGWIALERARIVSRLPGWMVGLGVWVLFAIFALRGLSTYLFVTGLRTLPDTAAQAFVANDIRVYAPLCLLLAMGFLILALQKGGSPRQA